MANQENCTRVTRWAAKKRAAEETAMILYPHNKKKRVALSEISNVYSPEIVDLEKNQKICFKNEKPRSNPNKKKLMVLAVDLRSDDPQFCQAYASDIYEYFHNKEMEIKKRPLVDYIEKVQDDMTTKMRMILIDWLVEVAEEYKLLSDTLFLTVSYIDRFLSLNSIKRERLQLLGVSSMLIASKYEEIHPPEVDDFCYITENTYSKKEIVKMEADVLKSLKFELGNFTAKTFLGRLIRIGQKDYEEQDLEFESLANYIAELSLLDYECLRFKPSLVAASVVFLTRFILKPEQQPWNWALESASGYKPCDMKECVSILHDWQSTRKGSNFVGLKEKYKQGKFRLASMIKSPAELVPDLFFQDIKVMPNY